MADIAGLVVGGIGTATGIAALVYAHLAKRSADASTRIANDGRDLAQVANELATEANTIATDARQLAEDANEMSRRGEARETERHDVHWDGDWQEPGIYIMTKLGDDAAHNVSATVVYDGERMTATAELMAGADNQLTFEFPAAVSDFRQEVRNHQRRKQQAASHPFSAGAAWGTSPHRVAERVEWTTPRGTPKFHESDAGLQVFDGFYPD